MRKVINEAKISFYDEDDNDWIIKTMQRKYDESSSNPEYRYFLINKFSFIKK